MAILADFHMHSCFSGDSEAPMEEMVLQAIRAGMREICFTEHMDLDFPAHKEEEEGMFEVDLDAYLKKVLEMRKRYGDRIRIGYGLELGLQPQLAERHTRLIRRQEFDFVIGSSHVCNGRDPYYPEFYEGRTEEEAYREYFQSEIDNIKKFSDFDVYGHLDYVVRYGPNRDREYTYEKYRDLLDQILKLLLENGKGLELNTGGIPYGLRNCTLFQSFWCDTGSLAAKLLPSVRTPINRRQSEEALCGRQAYCRHAAFLITRFLKTGCRTFGGFDVSTCKTRAEFYRKMR